MVVHLSSVHVYESEQSTFIPDLQPFAAFGPETSKGSATQDSAPLQTSVSRHCELSNVAFLLQTSFVSSQPVVEHEYESSIFAHGFGLDVLQPETDVVASARHISSPLQNLPSLHEESRFVFTHDFEFSLQSS